MHLPQQITALRFRPPSLLGTDRCITAFSMAIKLIPRGVEMQALPTHMADVRRP
jgi:hypothetical protein